MRIHKGGARLLPSNDRRELAFFLLGMRKDNVGEIIVKDALILEYGRSFVRRFGNDKEQYGYIRGKMRQLGRLLICLHQLSGK